MPAWLRLVLPVTPESTLEATGQELMDGHRTGLVKTGLDTVGQETVGLDMVGLDTGWLDTVGPVTDWLVMDTPDTAPWCSPQATLPIPLP